MASAVVIGAQWGDEGKGKIVDLLCQQARWVVRWQGGPNAGHTLSVDGRKTFLHHIPSGVLHAGRRCVLGNGMVLDPDAFVEEVEGLRGAGLDIDGRILVSDRAHLIFPHHRALDRAVEGLPDRRIGTTGKGVGYAYSAKVGRVGIRGTDLGDAAELQRRLSLELEVYEAWRGSLPDLPQITLADLKATAGRFRELLAPFLARTSALVTDALERGEDVLFEGSQGTLLDVDHGTYPYVTSSSTVAGSVCAGAGVGPRHVGNVIGVYKAYSTRVGEGPMPTEDPGADGERLRTRGNEFGTTTGRPRRCGWFDAVAGRYAARVNGLRRGALMLLDVLDTFDEIRVAVSYETASGPSDEFPSSVSGLSAARPVYETLPGWRQDTTGCRTWESLPAAARAYVERLEALMGLRFEVISVGPDRDATLFRPGAGADTLFEG